MNYRIVSGHLIINYRFFGKESLRPGSFLRHLMGLENQWSSKVKHIHRDGNEVHILYDRNDTVYLEDDFKAFITRMKRAYGDEIKGQITVTKIRGMRDFLDMTVDF